MKKTRKQLLGLAGLAIVGIMTAVAYSLPAPEASAAVESDTKVQVLVGEQNSSGTFTAPLNDSSTTRSVIPIVFNVSQAVKVEFYLVQRPAAPSPQMRTVADTKGELLYTCTPTSPVDVCRFDFNASNYGGLGEYVIRAFVTDISGVTYSVDTVAFVYTAAVIGDATSTDEKNDPIVTIDVNEQTDRVVVKVYGKDGRPILDKDGKQITIELTSADIDHTTGKITTTLPFEKYGLKAGDYTLVVDAYDKNGQLLSTSTLDIAYSPAAAVTPNVPNTGFLSAGSLNISRTDCIITVMIAFVLVSGFAIVVVYRKSHR